MYKILVTGGAGFIGSHICESILKNFKVKKLVILDYLTYSGKKIYLKNILKLKNVEFIQEDILNLYKIKNKFKNFDIAINLAAESHVDRSFKDSINFTMTNTLGAHIFMQTCVDSNIKKIMHVSTDEVYGQVLTNSKSEKDRLNPTNPYSASKAAAEVIINSYDFFQKKKIIIVRANNIYGIRQFPEKLIPSCIFNILKNKKIKIHGNGKNVRCFLSVLDFSDAINILLRKNVSGIFNIGNNKYYRNIDVAKTICKIMKKKAAKTLIFVKDRLFNDFRYSVSSFKMKKLGWKPKRSLTNDLPFIIEWYKKNISIYKSKV
jgi:dTDP-glucose 4,6-dehydratase